jgi:TonB family protein
MKPILPVLLTVSLAGMLVFSAGCSSSPPHHRLHATMGSMPFPEYDAAFLKAIEDRWRDLLRKADLRIGTTGKVVVRFHLNETGTISDLHLVSSTVSPARTELCLQAVSDQSALAPWPPKMNQMVGKPYREIEFTFNYN